MTYGRFPHPQAQAGNGTFPIAYRAKLLTATSVCLFDTGLTGWGYLWDSWGDHVTNAVSANGTRLTVPDYCAARLGAANYFPASIGGTGFLATNVGTALKYRDRVGMGDIDAARIGVLDLVVMPTSTNDVATAAGFTSAQVRAEIPLAIAALRAAQPNAIIAVSGPQYTTAQAAVQDWYDQTKGGVADSGDANAVYVDNSPSGGNWLNTTINPLVFTGSNAHMNDVGQPYYGNLLAEGIISAVRAKYGL
jgi:hypothetical protein